MEGGDPGQVLVGQLPTDALFHLCCGLIGEGHAENIGSGDAQHIHQIHIPRRKRFGFSGARTGHHPDIPFRSGHSLCLGGIELRKIVHGYLQGNTLRSV